MTASNNLAGLRARLDDGQQSAQALALAALARMEKEPVRGVRPIAGEAVREMAAYAAERIKQDSVRDLTGIPVAVGPEMLMRGVNADYDATIIRKLRGYGTVIVAQAESPCAAVSGGAVRVAFGTFLLSDAPSCRVYALRPSFGAVSRYGIASAPSLTQAGVAARTPAECATGMDAISDFDPYDPAMLRPNCYNYAERIGQPVRNLRIGATEGAPTEGIRVSQTMKLVSLGWAEALYELTARAEEGIAGKAEKLSPAHYEKIRASRGQVNREFEGALGLLDALLLTNSPSAVAAVALCGLAAVATPGGLLIVPKRYRETVALQIAGALQMEEMK